MFERLARAFRPLDTTAVDAAIAAARSEHQAVRVRARALRIGISCEGAASIIQAAGVIGARGYVLRHVFAAPTEEPVPPTMLRLLDRIKPVPGGTTCQKPSTS